MPAIEQQKMVEALLLAGLGQAVPEAGPTFATPIGNVTGRPEVYGPLMEMLATGPIGIGRLREAPQLAGRPTTELLQALTLLVAGGYAHPMLPAGVAASGRESARRLNQAIAQVNAAGSDLPRLAAPAIGSAVGTDMLETLVVGSLLAGRKADVASLSAEALAVLANSGRSVQRDGKPVTDAGEARQIVAEAIDRILKQRLPVLRKLGVLDG